MVSKDSQMSLQNKCLLFFKSFSKFFLTLIEQGFALVYIVDNLLLSDSKEHMFQLIEQLHIISTKPILNWLLKNPLLCSLKSNFLDMKLVTIQLNRYIQKSQLFTRFLAWKGCWQSCSNEFHWRTQFLHKTY